MKQRASLLTAACGLVLALSASAQDASSEKTQAQIDALQKQIDELTQAQQTGKVSATEQPKTSVSYGRFTLTSADGRNSIAFRTTLQGDAAYYDQDPVGPLNTDFRRGSVGGVPNRENQAARDLSSGFYLRRARIGFEGILNRDFSYRFVMELGGAGTEAQGRINDAWTSYTGLAPFTFQIGVFAPPTNLGDGTSADDTTFIERSSATELSRSLGGADGRFGVGLRASGTRWLGALSFTGRTVADPEVYDSQQAVVGRGAFLVMTSADYNLHVGANATYVLHPADQGLDAGGARYAIRFRDRPELRVDSTRLIDTGTMDAQHAYAAGVEIAGNWRNLQAEAENFWFGVERNNSTATDPRFGGYYAQGSWFITGESRRYVIANGAYQSPRPRLPFSSGGGTGALELALRFSHADFNFEEGLAGIEPSADGVRGGEQDVWTLGVNWYATPNVKLMLNVLRVEVDRLNPATVSNPSPFGAGAATPPFGAQIGQQLNAYALRTQFNF